MSSISLKSLYHALTSNLPIKFDSTSNGAMLTISMCAFTLMGCQSRPHDATHPRLKPVVAPSADMDANNIRFSTTTDPSAVSDTTILLLPSRLPAFNIQGKIGATVPATDSTPKSSGSAFYAWAQADNRFAINLTGALGIGRTTISYDGVSATLSSERTGTVSASHPDELLTQATGWQAPISQLPYWISGSPAPSDNSGTVDNYRRLVAAKNAGWNATFDYADDTTATLPDKIKILRDDGHKFIMTINHNEPTIAFDTPSTQQNQSDSNNTDSTNIDSTNIIAPATPVITDKILPIANHDDNALADGNIYGADSIDAN